MREYEEGARNPFNVVKAIKYKLDFKKQHPDAMDVSGLRIYCGAQGQGKTLTAVKYIKMLSFKYPKAIICSNTWISGLNPESKVVMWDGLNCLKTLENGYEGVIYFVDEIHLEFNSLESKNIPIEVMIEISQQRKQRKHIVGTSQIFMRMAKPLREQVKDVCLCRCYFGLFQHNKYIDGLTAYEKDGKLVADIKKVDWFFHSPADYGSYDTYAKMGRLQKEWNGRSIMSTSEFYEGQQQL